MANRKDSKGRVLKVGESQRKDGTYMYRYTDTRGKRQSVYASDLKELREKEKVIHKNLDDGIDYAADVYPHYGSDVEATLRGGADARHALIGAGVYASHGYERSHVDGVKNTLELLAAYLDK